MKKIILTDLNDPFYKNFSNENIQLLIDNLNNRIINDGIILFGEFINDTPSLDISLKNVSHSISNIKIENNKIYGNVSFLKNDTGKNAEKYFNKNKKMTMRANGILNELPYSITSIFTWDIIF